MFQSCIVRRTRGLVKRALFSTRIDIGGMCALIVGPPGSGKGTMSARLTDDFGFVPLASGDAFRAQIADGSDLGKQAQKYINEGELVPDDLTCNLMVDFLKNHDADNLLLDGFPRTVAQAKVVDELDAIDMVLHLNVPDAIILERMTQRRVHLPSGRVYHLEFNPPQEEGLDDVTGEPLITRDDDKEETVLHRLEVYHAETEPIIDHFKNQGLVQTFSGTESNVIYPRLKAYIQGYRRGRGLRESSE